MNIPCLVLMTQFLLQVIAYIMKEYSINLSVALEYVKKIRSCVNPNPGFQRQLELYNGILEARLLSSS